MDVEPPAEGGAASPPSPTTFAERLRALLREYDPHDLAAAVGLSRACLYHYAAGRRQPNLAKLAAICRATGLSADYLLGLPERPLPPYLLASLLRWAEEGEAEARELRRIVESAQ